MEQPAKPPTKRTTNDGFTLIELSLTLVIIGLLVAGILNGREMIATARTRAYSLRFRLAMLPSAFPRFAALP